MVSECLSSDNHLTTLFHTGHYTCVNPDLYLPIEGYHWCMVAPLSWQLGSHSTTWCHYQVPDALFTDIFSIIIQINWYSYWSLIATNFCMCHDSTAVMACATFGCNLMNKNWISAKCFASLDLNCEQNLLVKWAVGLVLIHGNCSGGGLLLVSWTHSCSIGLTHWCPETVIFIIKCYSQM